MSARTKIPRAWVARATIAAAIANRRMVRRGLSPMAEVLAALPRQGHLEAMEEAAAVEAAMQPARGELHLALSAARQWLDLVVAQYCPADVATGATALRVTTARAGLRCELAELTLAQTFDRLDAAIKATGS